MNQKQLEFLLLVETGLQELYASEEWAQFQKRVDEVGYKIEKLAQKIDDIYCEIKFAEGYAMVLEHELE